jgi:DNA (cytosine-5)-methyltransferase 1
MMENVEEIQTWGPLLPNGRPNPVKTGQTYRRFIQALERLGYKVETNILVSADYGAPTTRQRWFLVARCDGRPIVWPEPTHMPRAKFDTLYGWAAQGMKPWVPVADVIDWTLPCPSIFDSKADIKAQYGCSAVRPLSDNTLARIARGIKRFVMENPEPFVVSLNHAYKPFRGQKVDEPLRTITAQPGYGIVTSMMVSLGQTGAGDGRVGGVDEPLQTVTDGGHHMVIAPVMVRNNTGTAPHSPKEPIGALTTGEQMMMVAPSLIQYHQEREGEEARGQAVEKPIMTLDASNRYALVSAFIHQFYDGGYKCDGRDPRQPCPTVTACDHNSVACAFLTQFNNHCIGQDLADPINTITAGQGHFGEVRAFLLKYYGNEGFSSCHEPMPTATTKDRFGLVTVQGVDYVIVDIGLRMLTPRELFLAQGFPADYEIEKGADGRAISKAEQVARCGNAVTPQVPEALVRANLPEMCQTTAVA